MMDATAKFLAAVQRGDAAAVAGALRAQPELAHAAGEHDKTGLHLAAEADHLEIARALVEAGADVEARTSWGATPLAWAATLGSIRVADLLLSHGAGGVTLAVAAALGMRDAVERIVSSSDDLASHRRIDAPRTPDEHWPADSAHFQGDVLSDALVAAARNGQTTVVELLLDRGAWIDAKGVFGATALHWAAINGHAATIHLLLGRGANAGLKDPRFDATPEGWAREGGHADLAAALRSAGRTGP